MPISKPKPILANRLALHLGACALTLCVGSFDRAIAQATPDSENGRYTFSPVGADFLRLDTRTGVVSTCSNNGGWVCRALPDERAALDSEIGRLQTENKKLKDQLAQPNSSSAQTPDTSKKTDKAPSNFDQLQTDNQKLLAMIDRIWDRLIEMAVQIQKKLSEKI